MVGDARKRAEVLSPTVGVICFWLDFVWSLGTLNPLRGPLPQRHQSHLPPLATANWHLEIADGNPGRGEPGMHWHDGFSVVCVGIPMFFETGSPAPNKGHLRGHDSEEENVSIKRQAGHRKHSLAHMVHVHRGFWCDTAVGLQYSGSHPRSQVCAGVADIYLADRDIKWPAVERARLGQASDGMLCCCVRGGIRPWGRRRDRAVVDNPPTAR